MRFGAGICDQRRRNLAVIVQKKDLHNCLCARSIVSIEKNFGEIYAGKSNPRFSAVELFSLLFTAVANTNISIVYYGGTPESSIGDFDCGRIV